MKLYKVRDIKFMTTLKLEALHRCVFGKGSKRLKNIYPKLMVSWIVIHFELHFPIKEDEDGIIFKYGNELGNCLIFLIYFSIIFL
jgi:hypothetical protein